MYIKQKNTGDAVVVVLANAEEALSLYPELFEKVDGDAPENVSYLNFSAPDGE